MIPISAKNERFSLVAVFGCPMLFSEMRIDNKTIPDGLYKYEVRHCDEDWGEPAEISEGVWVNFYGTLISKKPIEDWDQETNGSHYKFIEFVEDGKYEYPRPDNWSHIEMDSLGIDEFLSMSKLEESKTMLEAYSYIKSYGFEELTDNFSKDIRIVTCGNALLAIDESGKIYSINKVQEQSNNCKEGDESNEFFQAVVDNWRNQGEEFDFVDYTENGGNIVAWKIIKEIDLGNLDSIFK